MVKSILQDARELEQMCAEMRKMLGLREREVEEGEAEEEVCPICGGTGELTYKECVDPGEPHMADIGTMKCECQIKEEEDDDQN